MVAHVDRTLEQAGPCIKAANLSVELKERWAGSEDMMLNVFDEAHDKIAEIIFRVDKDRAGRKFLAVKDQNTVKKFRARRLMTLMHFFLFIVTRPIWCIT